MVDKLRLQVLMIGTFLDALSYIKDGRITIEELEDSLSRTKRKLIDLANSIEKEEEK